MNEIFDVSTLIFLAIAVVLILRLRSVLGKRTGHERPPFDPYSSRESHERQNSSESSEDNVVQMPRKSSGPISEANKRDWSDYAKADSPLAETFDSFVKIDQSFDPASFIQGARAAYEMIVTAFAAADRKTLKPLLGPEVLEGFMEAIDQRESRGEEVESTFISLDEAKIVDGDLVGSKASLTVKFISKLISVTKDKDGAVIDGDPTDIHKVTDVWTFTRDLKSRNLNWKLVATESAH